MIARIFNALLKRWGSTDAKQRVWNREYKLGKWKDLDPKEAPPSRGRDMVYAVLEKYAAGGDLLDLGCGSGSTGSEMADVYRYYVGVDVSDVAIRQAVSAIKRNPTRASKNEYLTGDIANFVPSQTFSVILFRESLMYFPETLIRKVLSRYDSFLKGDGVFIVRMHDRNKYKKILRLIEREYRVIECLEPESSRTVVIVFRPQDTPPGTLIAQTSGGQD